MNYYSFHVGDYASHTKHLTLMGDLAYRRLLDLYYIGEGPLPLDPAECARKIGMREHIQDVSEVLSDFFLKSENGHISKRCEAEIEVYRAKAERAKSANLSRWGNKKSDPSLKSDVKSDVKSDPLCVPTNNQEPITNNQDKLVGVPQKKSRRKPQTEYPADFYPNQTGLELAAKKQLDVPAQLEKFRNHHLSKGSLFADWQATWRTWCGNAYPSTDGRQSGQRSQPQTFAERDREAGMKRWEEMTGQVHPDRQQTGVQTSTVIDAEAKFLGAA